MYYMHMCVCARGAGDTLWADNCPKLTPQNASARFFF